VSEERRGAIERATRSGSTAPIVTYTCLYSKYTTDKVHEARLETIRRSLLASPTLHFSQYLPSSAPTSYLYVRHQSCASKRLKKSLDGNRPKADKRILQWTALAELTQLWRHTARLQCGI